MIIALSLLLWLLGDMVRSGFDLNEYNKYMIMLGDETPKIPGRKNTNGMSLERVPKLLHFTVL